MRLVRDDARADDVAQQAWLAAVRQPPSSDVAPRAWLGGVVRNWVRRGYRDAARQRRREVAGARPEAQPSTADMVARADAHRRVVNAVFALDEPYRSTVLARFFEDLPPRAIARRMGVPVETVRTRLKRALALLRAELDAEYGRDGRSWGVALLPLAMKGGLVVKSSTKVGLVAAALLLLAGGTTLWFAGDAADEPSANPSATIATAVAVAPAPRAVPPVPAEVEPPAPEGTASVRGEVWFTAPERPAAGVAVAIGPAGNAHLLRTDDAGRFRATGLPTGFRGSVRVRADGSGDVVRTLMPLRDGEEHDVGILRLAGPAAVDVVVTSFEGAPIEGAEVEAWRTPMRTFSDPTFDAAQWRDVPDPDARGLTDAQGRVRIENLEPDTWTFGARKSGWVAATSLPVALASGEIGGPVRIVTGQGHAVTGRVVDRGGVGVPGVVVWAQVRNGYEHMDVQALMPHATSGADGAFAIDGLSAGDFDLRVQRGGAPLVTAAKVRVPTSVPLELRLDGRRVVGTVREALTGAPVPGALVRANAGELFNVIEAVSDVEGRFVLDTVIDVELISGIRVTKAGFVEVPDPVRTKDPNTDPGLWLNREGDTALELVMRRGARLVGRVAAGDEPVRGAQVIVQRQRAPADQTATDSDGRYVVDGIERGPALIQVITAEFVQKDWDWDRASAFWNGQASSGDVDVPESGEVVHDVAMERGVAIEGHVIDSAGAPVAGAVVTGNMLDRVTTRADGAFRVVAGVVRGGVFVHAQHPETGWGSLQEEVPADRAIAGATITLKPYPRLRGRVTATSQLRGAWVQWAATPQGDFEPWWGNARPRPVEADGTFEFAVQAVDSVVVRAGAPGFPSVTAAATKEQDGSFAVEVYLAPGATLVGRAVVAGTRAPVGGAEVMLVELKGAGLRVIRTGAPMNSVVAAVAAGDGRFVIEQVPPGSRLLRVQAEGFVAVEKEIDIPADGEVVVELERGRTISGSVAFSDGTPVVRASISATQSVDDARYAGGERRNYFGFAKTDEAGRYTIASLPAGTFDLLVSQGVSQEQFANAEREGVAAGSVGVDFTVHRKTVGLRLRGRVVDTDGFPVGRATVNAEPSSGRAWGHTTSRDDGTFEMDALEAVAYTVRASPPPGSRFIDVGVSFGARLLTGSVEGVQPPRDDVVVTMPTGETIAGVVVDTSGAPVANVWVAIGMPLPAADVRARGSPGPAADDTDADGRFEITGLRPGGTYRLVALGVGGVREPAPLIGGERVTPGSRGLRLTVGSFAQVKGRVVDALGDAVPGANVSAFGTSERSTTTDAEGRFTLVALDAGSAVDVVAWTDTLAPTTLRSVSAGAEGLRIELREGRRSSGRALTKDGKPLALTRLLLRTPACPVAVETTTDREGRFEARGLLDARYRAAYVGLVEQTYREIPCGEFDAGTGDVELRAQ